MSCIVKRLIAADVWPMETRLFCTTPVANKIIPDNLKGKSASSQAWLTRQLNDPYVKMARYRNYRARSAFKLIEIDDKFGLLKPGMTVVDCGAAPGSWTQVIVERLQLGKAGEQLAARNERSPAADRGKVIAIDINAFSPIEGAHILPNLDFTKPISQAHILSLLDGRTVDVVCSDMAPNAAGIGTLDHENQIALVFAAISFALPVLTPKSGALLAKIWQGTRDRQVLEAMSKFFGQVRVVKPPACHAESVETYVLGTEFKGIVRQ